MTQGGSLAAVLAVVLLAGCGGLAGGGTDATASGTPTLMDDDGATPTDYPAGLSADGVENAYTLVETHRSALRNRSYTARSNTTVRRSDGSTRRDVVVTRYAADTEGGRRTVSLDSRRLVRTGGDFEQVARTELYAEGDRLYVARTGSDGSTRYLERNRIPIDNSLRKTFAGFETTVTGTSTGDAVRYRVESTGIADAEVLREAVRPNDPEATVVNASLVAVVDGRGVVLRYRFRWTVETGDGATHRGITRVRLTDIGDTTVERPDWFEEADETG